MAPRDLTARYIQLVNQLGDDLGRPRGWRLRVAVKLGVDAPTLSRILRGNRQVGWDLAERAIERLRLQPHYFTQAAAFKGATVVPSNPPPVPSDDDKLGELVRRLETGSARQADVYALARAVAESTAVKRATRIIKTPPPRTEQDIGALFVAAAHLVDDLRHLMSALPSKGE